MEGHSEPQPFPKRRRIEPESPSSETIAPAHLQYLQGSRQNRWLSGWAGPTMESDVESASASHPATVAGMHVNAATNKNQTSIVTIDLEQEGTNGATAADVQTATASPLQQQERVSSFHNRRMPPQALPLLVQPLMGDTNHTMAVPVPSANGTARKSLDPSARVPGLPSPAPSDENTNSPTFSESQLATMRARSHVTLRNDMNTGGAVPPTAPSASAASTRSPALPFGQLPRRQSSLSGQQQQQQLTRQAHFQQPLSPGALQQQAQQQAARGHHPISSTLSNIQVASYATSNTPYTPNTLRTPPTLSSNYGHAQQRPPRPSEPTPLPASRIPTEQLHGRLNDIEYQLRSVLGPTDKGRLTLLRDAVTRGDWFYQLLSQIFCLRTTSPDLLPKSIRTLHPSSFEHLGFLLCSNTDVNQDLLGFFCRFPEPMMDIYSDASNYREVYEVRTAKIRQFLTELPLHWNGLVTVCKERLSPPLVQDMVDILKLGSAVLQTTCFRAIARMFWGVQDSAGIKILEQVHEIDQSSFYVHGFRRNDQEKHAAYVKLGRMYDTWNQASASVKAQPAIPQDVLDFFQSPSQALRSQMQQVRQSQIQQQAQIQQRQQLQPQQAQQGQQFAIPQASSAQQALAQRYLQSQGFRPGEQDPGSPIETRVQFQVPPQQRLPTQLQVPIAAVQTPYQQPGSPQPTLNNQRMQRGAPPMLKIPIFPHSSQCPRSQLTHPDPNRCGIHQSYLRSPILKRILGPTGVEVDAPRLFRHVIGYAAGPTQVKKHTSSQLINFSISEKTMSKLAKTYPPSGVGERATRFLSEESITYRLRCATLPPRGFDSEGAWVVADNYWPEGLAFELNGNKLEQRRKLHHGRYLPVDLTTFLNAGENRLKVLVTHRKEDQHKVDYAVAVEAVGVVSAANIHNRLQRISAEKSLTAIKKHLAGGDSADDDDFAVTSSSMVIKLFDPFSGSKMVDIPVRGVNCLHKDVFDLDVFLTMCRREQPQWPSIVDCWRCPLCRGDVRPQTLVIDEFLVSVLDELKKRRLHDVKAIIVDPDGSWKPKEEKRTGVRSPSFERDEGRRSTTVTNANTAPAQKPIEIIELD